MKYVSLAQRRRRSERRAAILFILAGVVVFGVCFTFLFLQALHHGHKAGLSTEDVIYGV